MSSPPGSLLDLRTGNLENLFRFAEGGYLYAILDAYDNPLVPQKVKELGDERGICLFTGDAQTRYWGLAPYMVAVDRSLLGWMVETVWKAPWGVFLLSKQTLAWLGAHFRCFLTVRLPDGERWYFRYYDPRILQIYLSNCQPQELLRFFGPVRAFAIPDSESENINFLHFQPDAQQQEGSTDLPDGPPLVRQEHFEVIQKVVLGDFEERTMSFLTRAHPEQAGRLGQEGLRQLIQYGSVRAQRYQIAGEDERSQFIEIMLLLGRNFDQESNFKWAQTILKDPRTVNVRERISLLREAAQRLPAS